MCAGMKDWGLSSAICVNLAIKIALRLVHNHRKTTEDILLTLVATAKAVHFSSSSVAIGYNSDLSHFLCETS